MYAGKTIYTDTDINAIEALPLKAWHRAVDVEVVKADTEGSYFISCHLIFCLPDKSISRIYFKLHHPPTRTI